MYNEGLDLYTKYFQLPSVSAVGYKSRKRCVDQTPSQAMAGPGPKS
jgi:hypothetical protein